MLLAYSSTTLGKFISSILHLKYLTKVHMHNHIWSIEFSYTTRSTCQARGEHGGQILDAHSVAGFISDLAEMNQDEPERPEVVSRHLGQR